MNKVLQLRHDYCVCIKLANETDSKKEDAELRIEAAQILIKLKENCPHEDVVCLRSEYHDYSDPDYNHDEQRICLCCGIYESAWDKKFEKLITEPFSRLEINYYSDKLPEQMKNPLNFLLSEAKEIALEKSYRCFGRVARL